MMSDCNADPHLFQEAHQTALEDLLTERLEGGHWEGRLSSSPLSTATAISALAIDEQSRTGQADEPRPLRHAEVLQSLKWLASHQNQDGGWGDTDKSVSNIATSYLVQSAFRLTGVPAGDAGILERAHRYCESQGGIDGLRSRYGRDKTFAVPILTNAAIAGLVPWREVSQLPFELACLPQSWYRWLQLPVVSYAIPALVAIGQAKFAHAPPFNPITRLIRRRAVAPSLDVLQQLQPESGGFLEATPLTSFVVMSLASIGRGEHPVVRRGVRFLVDSRRPDGSWPIDTNLSLWTTSWSLAATLGPCGSPPPPWLEQEWPRIDRCFEWLLAGQHRQIHPYTGAAPGGWAWTDLSGGVMDVDDTSAALLAIARFHELAGRYPTEQLRRCERSGQLGVQWLLDVQNRDGGWPTFCRGWGKLPFDRSATDLTAHAARALFAWQRIWGRSDTGLRFRDTIDRAIGRGMDFLNRQQRHDGSWVPLWFGNQFNRDEENPVYGTARVLTGLAELGYPHTESARRGVRWLMAAQHDSGGWGACETGSRLPAGSLAPPSRGGQAESLPEWCSVEETGLAVAALSRFAGGNEECRFAVARGAAWLADRVRRGGHLDPAPIGFYFAKLWYYERLYSRICAVEGLRAAVHQPEGVAATPPPLAARASGK